MSRLVCRKCWTWYSDRETSCPRCRTPLVAVDAAPDSQASALPVAPSAPAAPLAPAQPPTESRPVLLRPRFFVAAVAIVAVVAIAVLTLAPGTTSADKAFSVKIPSGWHQNTDFVLPGGEKPVMALVGQVTDGIQAHIIITNSNGRFVRLSDVDQQWATVLGSQSYGLTAGFSALTPTTIGGSDAVVTTYHAAGADIEFIIVDHANHTYLIGFSAASSQFASLRDGDFASLLASWHWN